MLFFLALCFAFLMQLPTVSCFPRNLTTVLSIEPEAERQYYNYFSHFNVESPLKEYLSSPRDVYVISKATEFVVSRYKKPGRFLLRGILSIKHHGNDYHLKTLLHDTKSKKLKQKEFHVSINERKDGRYDVQDVIKYKRSSPDSNQDVPCDRLSTIANCSSCGFNGICHKGASRISSWLSFALRTQRALQINMSFIQVQMLAAHNAFNDRTDGYGIADDCAWPPPYKNECVDLANQEFSFTDLLNMGVRALEIDPWWCFGKIRMSHAHDYAYLGCGPWDREFKDGIQEIADWKKLPENRNEIVRIYLEDGETHTRGHDDLVNGPIGEYFGDMVLTPRDLQVHFGGKWPTPYQMQRLGKTVLISAANDYNHQGKFIHKGYWQEITTNKFRSYTGCDAMQHLSSPVRVYSDSTKYGPFWNGPERTGTVMDYLELMKCGVIYTAADQVNPQLISSAVFTWGKNEPNVRLSRDSCVMLSAKDERWHVADCDAAKPFVCKIQDGNKWIVSLEKAKYSSIRCPSGSIFSIPRNAFEHHQLLDLLTAGQDVWINITPFAAMLVDH